MYRKVGNHLPHCKERNGRDYSQHLAPKTLKKKAQSLKKTKCPKCDKLFVRLDVHLRKNVSCRSISSKPSLPSRPVHSHSLPHSRPTQPSSEAAIFSSINSNSNFAVSVTGVDEITTNTSFASP